MASFAPSSSDNPIPIWTPSSSSPAFPDETYEDSCSICLEPFCSDDPATVRTLHNWKSFYFSVEFSIIFGTTNWQSNWVSFIVLNWKINAEMRRFWSVIVCCLPFFARWNEMKCDLMSILLFFFTGVLLVSGERGDRTVMCKVLFRFVIIKLDILYCIIVV